MDKIQKTHYAIECRGISKHFGKIIANDKINLAVKRGEVLALLGENGAGKTTLMNMISGIYHPDEGQIYINGEAVSINSPTDATKFGIGMIHQHFKLVDVYSAMENIVLGTKDKLPKTKVLREQVTEISERYGLNVIPDKKVYDMSVSEKQTVEILKVLYKGADILILDEPTAVLTPQETQKLFDILRKMKEQGKAVIIITHKLNEVLEISDRVTILRKGQSVATVTTKATNAKVLTELMVGRPIDLALECPKYENPEKVLEIVQLSVMRPDKSYALNNVSFSINSGQVLGVAGVAGSGQKELCEAIAGIIKPDKGAILYHQEEIAGKTTAEIIKMGITMSFVPEDRLGMGLVPSMGMTDNMLLKTYNNKKGVFVDRKSGRQMATEIKDKLIIQAPDVETPVRRLSGGNVQKVLIGREIELQPSVLITAYPVRGLDINSSYMIYDLINEQKMKGVAIILVGEDIDVLMGLSDRIMVMCNGEITGIVDPHEVTKDEIGLLMAGRQLEVKVNAEDE